MAFDPHHEDEIGGLLHLFEDGAFSRRELLSRLTRRTGSIAAATALVASAGLADTNPAACLEDVRVPADVGDLEIRDVEFSGAAGPLFAHWARPRQDEPTALPAVLVIHENRGLTEHIRDVTRRVARAGYVALGIDLLSRQGGTAAFPDPEAALAAYRNVTEQTALEDMQAALAWLRDQPNLRADRIGAMGFCAGGGNAFNLAVTDESLAAAVIFYGFPPTPIERLSTLNAPVLGIYAELDRTFTGRVPALLTALNEQRKTYSLHVYEGVNHAFHNDTGARYDGAAACDAWARTTAFFLRHLARE